MHRSAFSLALLAAATTTASRLAAAEPNALTADEKRAGFVLLFDGRTTAGWTEVTGKPVPDSWTVDDGCLKPLAQPSMQDIRTVGVYRNFELRWEWKLAPGGNSGVKYLVQKTDEWNNKNGRQARARGPEYQLLDDASGIETLPEKKNGSLYGVRAPVKQVSRPIGEFNESRIIVDGRKAQHWLNGQLIVEYSLDDADVRKVAGSVEGETYVSLQNHGGKVWFRSVKIRKW